MFKKKTYNALIDSNHGLPNHGLSSNHDISDEQLMDYPNTTSIVKNQYIFIDENKNRNDFNKLMFLLFDQREPNRLKKIATYVMCMNMKGENHITPLMMAAKMARGDESMRILEYVLVNSDVNEIDAQDSEGRSALMYACLNVDTTSSIEACHTLLKRGANPNLLDDKGCNSMMLYALNYKSGNSIALIQMLINNNVNIFQSSTNNRLNAIMIACKRYEFTHDTKLITQLLAAGANINQRDRDGNTALMQLCSGNIDENIDLIKIFIDRKANVEISNNYGETVYDMLFAQRSDKKNDIINMFIK